MSDARTVFGVVVVVGIAGFFVHVCNSYSAHSEKYDALRKSEATAAASLSAQAERMVRWDEIAQSAKRAELARIANESPLFPLPKRATCTSEDGAKLLTALGALKRELELCVKPPVTDEACFERLGRQQVRVSWVTRQLEELPMPQWFSTDENGDAPAYEAYAAHNCCTCADDAPQTCRSALADIAMGESKIQAWMKKNGTRNDENCALSTAQIQMLHRKR